MHKDELARTCRFQTRRLDVAEWHSTPLPAGAMLADVLTRLLTSTTTRSLPPSWHGDYDRDRAAAWIIERDTDSPTLLVTHRESATAVGLVILFERPSAGGSQRVDLRLGYLLAESAWGRGLGTELVAGFIEWCRSGSAVRSIAAGVELDNKASARVLTKNGFRPAETATDGEKLYELLLIDGQN
jgi:ribosomal-protein-alanine N-acetyltransferase